MLQQLISADDIKKIDAWIAKFPSTQKQSAVLATLLIIQKANHGWLTDALLEAVANYLDMPKIAVYEVATFYSMYELQPIGKHKISVCTNLPCQLRGCQKIVDHLEKKCQTKLGETSADGKFTLREVECMGACIGAPMLEYNDQYYENLTSEKVDALLESMK